MRSYLHKFEVDFDEIFIAFVKLIVFCIFVTIAAFYNLDINLIDIKTTFL